MRTRGTSLLLQALEEERVACLVSMPGPASALLAEQLARSPVVPVSADDGHVAACMALGAAFASQKPAALLLDAGTMVEEARSANGEASLCGVPALVVVCSPAGALPAGGDLALLGSDFAAVEEVGAVSDLYPAVLRLLRVARGRRAGPVALALGADLLAASDGTVPSFGEREPPVEAAPDPQLVEHAGRLLTAADHPALWVGGLAATASPALPRLAELLAAPVVSTVAGKGIFPEDHALWLGCVDAAPHLRPVRRLLRRCDCLLVLGRRPDETVEAVRELAPRARLIQVAADARRLATRVPLALAVEADPGSFVSALLGIVTGERPADRMRRAIARCRRHSSLDRRTGGRDGVDPLAVVAALSSHCRPDALFTVEDAGAVRLVAAGLRLSLPGCLLVASGRSPRLAVPAAVGAAVACPGRDVVALADEDAFLAASGALATAVTMRAAPLVCVLAGGRQPSDALESTARGAGWHHFRIVRDHELGSVLPVALDYTRLGEPVVVELALDAAGTPWPVSQDRRAGCLALPWPLLGGRRAAPGS